MSTCFRAESGSLTVIVLTVIVLTVIVLMVAVGVGCSFRKALVDEGSGTAPAPQNPTSTRPAVESSLFDGKSLDGWEIADFGGQGEVHVEEGVLVLPAGDPLTGVRWTRPFPTVDYEIEMMAQREEGTDFFCGLTFPVGDSCASLILGGWGGQTCGISSFEDMDASENETTFYRSFEMNRWYAVKLRVTKKRLEVWIDDEKVIGVDITGRRIGTRPEIDLCRPLGLASYLTAAGLRNVRWREVTSE